MEKTKFLTSFLIISIIMLSQLALSLPSSETRKTGNLCEKKHYLSYNYELSYPEQMIIGKSYDININFNINSGKVSQKPYRIKITATPKGFEVVNNKTIELKNDYGRITIIPLSKNPSLNLLFELRLDGDVKQHPRYNAVYEDKITINDILIFNSSSSVSTTTKTKTTTNKYYGFNDQFGEDITQELNYIENEINEINEILLENTSVEKYSLKKIDIHKEENIPSKIPWYISRLFGIVSFILLSFSITLALLKKINPRKYARKFFYHHGIALMAFVTLLIHIMTLLYDKYMWGLSIKDIFLPSFSTKIHTYISLGLFSFYLIIILVLSSLNFKIIGLLKRKRWYYIHLSSYIMYFMVIIHSIYLGSDLYISDYKNPVTLLSLSLFWIPISFNLILLTIAINQYLKKRILIKETEV